MAKVKICGITNIEDARLAVALGADMLGFNFYEQSPRYISPQEARRVIGDLPKETENVGVFVNMEESRVVEFVDLLGLHAVQLHGDENNDFVSHLRTETDAKVIKAIRVGPGFQARSIANYETDSILLDAYTKGQYGGTGERFEWSIAADAVGFVPELILAGGLTPDNVAEAVRSVRPYAVDVASGVESAPGKKDPAKLEAFITNAKQA
jgi:phosphoribosylanthranilate isomerase